MGQFCEGFLNAGFPKLFTCFASLFLPQLVHAECPAPKTPPANDRFHYCFDVSRVVPLPIIDPGNGPYLVVEVELNGHRLPALLDTGAGISVVDSTVANKIGLQVGGSAEITAIDDRKTAGPKALIDQLAIGGFVRNGGTVIVTNLGQMSEVARQPFGMVVGADVLSHVALAVNRDSQSVILMPSNAQVKESSRTARVRLQQPDNMFMTDMSVDGHRITVRLDTGADDELILRDTKWTELVPSTARTTTMIGIGAAGTFVKPLVRLATVKIGGQSTGDALATQVSSAASTGGSDGILGMGILSRFNLFLNPQTGVLVLTQPQKRLPPRRETMVGILGAPTNDGIDVMHVMAHSPAEAAGIKAGDRICTVDGQKVSASWAGTAKNDWMTGPDGKTVALGFCGGGEIRLTLRKFY